MHSFLTKNYLHHFVIWWGKATEIWHYEELLQAFIETCWDIKPAAIAAGLLQKRNPILASGYALNLPDIA
jgi:hypothetical protein